MGAHTADSEAVPEISAPIGQMEVRDHLGEIPNLDHTRLFDGGRTDNRYGGWNVCHVLFALLRRDDDEFLVTLLFD